MYTKETQSIIPAWHEPIPFTDKESDTTNNPFPVDALPAPLNGAVLAMSRIIQAPNALCSQSVLAVANLATQRLFDVEIDGRRYPSSLYLLTVGASGERKSACDTAAMTAVSEAESTLRAEHDPLIQRYLDAKETYDAERRAILSKRSTSPGDKRAALKLLDQPPDKPAPPILRVTDVTIEGVQRSLAEGCTALGLFNDEGGTVLGGWSFKDDNELRAAAALSSLWDGKSVTRVRGGDGTKVLAGKRLCTHLQIQPIVAGRVLGSGLLQGQGLLARFLVAYPASTQGNRAYNPEELAKADGMAKFSERIAELLKQPLPRASGKSTELEPTALIIEGNAKKLWVNFYDTIERNLKPKGLFDPVRGLANKMPEHLSRLATTFAGVEGNGITFDILQSAYELADWYLNEALRLASPANELGEAQEAQLLWQFIAKQGWEDFSTQQIYQLGPEFARSATRAKRLLELLESHHWIRASGNGWEVNPHA